VKEIPPTIPPELGAGLVDLFNKCFYFESIQRASTMDVLEVIYLSTCAFKTVHRPSYT
jgi:hypothetical protein